MAAKSVRLLDVFLMLCLVLFWGSSFVVVKLALLAGLTPVAIATFRFLVAGAMFLGVLLFEKARKPGYKLLFEKKDAFLFVVLSLTGVTFFFIIQYIGIDMAGASIASILVCFLSPILISILSVRLFSEYLSRRQILGIVIAGIGTLVVITGGTMDIRSGNSSFLIGSLFLLLTPLLWAIYTLGGKRVLAKYDPFFVVAHVTILGGLFLLPFSLAENSFYKILSLNLQSWAAILYLAITCSLVGYSIWFYVINRINASITSSFLFAEPLVTVLFAILFVGETLTPAILTGGLLIFAGVFFVTRKQRSAQDKNPKITQTPIPD
jgi:drug/metabolite transporter (DMT)-like permease